MSDKKNAATATLEVAKTEEKSNLPVAPAPNFREDAGAGLEGADRDSFAIPFLALLQANSPQVSEIEAAKAGMFINTVTNELYKEVQVIPCAFQRRFVRWAPREDGGGYRGQYKPNEIEAMGIRPDEEGHLLLEGDELKDTRLHYVLVQSANGQWQPALISMASTQVKKSKRWNSRIESIQLKDETTGEMYRPASWSHIYKVRSTKEENNKGAWWGYEIDMAGPVSSKALYDTAKAFHKSVAAGIVEVTLENDSVAASDSNKF